MNPLINTDVSDGLRYVAVMILLTLSRGSAAVRSIWGREALTVAMFRVMELAGRHGSDKIRLDRKDISVVLMNPDEEEAGREVQVSVNDEACDVSRKGVG